jgi:predicted metalloendopeptidase
MKLTFAALALLAASVLQAQTATPHVAPANPTGPATHYIPSPAFDISSIDTKADPCTDFYKFACGNFAANHPIPSDQSGVDQFYLLYNVNTEQLNGILNKYAAPSPTRTPLEAKIGDYYAACMNTDLIEKQDLSQIKPLLDKIDHVTKLSLPALTGELQRLGVGVFFGFGEQQDFKDASKQVAAFDQGGLGLPERDYYTRTGDADKKLRDQYIVHLTQMLSFGGETPQQAVHDANAILAFETKLAQASMTNTDRRDPEKVYHPMTLAAFEASVKPLPVKPFFEAVHAPALSPDALVISGNTGFFPALVAAVRDTDIETLRAYMRAELLDAYASRLPKRFDAEHFHFYGTVLNGQPEQEPRWKRCSSATDGALGEALGQVYVAQYFPGDSKAKTLTMVHDIEAAMDKDIDTLEWMSPATRVKAKDKLHAVANKIGYPDHWRDYTKLTVSAEEPLLNSERANAFENDRQLAKIGKPVDHLEWGMSPPTVNAYYNPSMNDINFPAGILQPAFYDPKADTAVNYGHMGAVIGHELTHGFDDEGRKFDGLGNLSDWWSPEDTKKFESKAACLVNQYGNFVAVEDPKEPVHVNGKLTLGENTADNGGLVLAYMAYLSRAKAQGIDISQKTDGFTGPQRFYIAFAQNWCENSRPEQVRNQVLTDPHSPDHFRANGAIVNQPGFAPAFGCKVGQPMAPTSNCRVW